MKFHLKSLGLVVCGLISCGSPEAEVGMIAPSERVEAAQALTAEAFASLSGRLLEAISEDGHASAIGVCAMEAADLLSGVGEARNVSIRRVTDRPRNPANQADETDLEVMEMIRAMIANGEVVEASVKDDAVRLPIRIAMPLCLTCHGDAEQDIPAETLNAIRARYPLDRATGYREGELRGLWRVEFNPAPSP